MNPKTASTPVQITAQDVQGHGEHATVACPNPQMSAWNAHPRVFINVGHSGHGQCPYCGTVYAFTSASNHQH